MPYTAAHKARTRSRIVESARRLFNRHGFEQVTIDQIMAHAGLTRGGFYNHFGSKDNLIVAVASHILTSFASYADRSTSASDRGLPAIIGRLRAYTRATRRNRSRPGRGTISHNRTRKRFFLTVRRRRPS